MNKKILLLFVFLYCGYTAQASQLTVPASRFGANQVSSIVSRYWKLPAFGLGAAAFFQSNVGISSDDRGSWKSVKARLKSKYGVWHPFYWKELAQAKLRYLGLKNMTNEYILGGVGGFVRIRHEKHFLEEKLRSLHNQ